jgi:hypothetical protein
MDPRRVGGGLCRLERAIREKQSLRQHDKDPALRHCDGVKLVPIAAAAGAAGLLFTKKVAPPLRPVDVQTWESFQGFPQGLRESGRPRVDVSTASVHEDHGRRLNISLERLDQMRNSYVVLPHRRPSNDHAFSGGAQAPSPATRGSTVPLYGGTSSHAGCLCLCVRTIALGVILVAFGLLSTARACSPCDETLDLQATAIRAGLVVVAHRVGEGFTPASGNEQWTTFATFEVQKVLKGKPFGHQIDVAMRFMCGMGPDVERGRSAVLFLERREDRYYPVRGGCAIRNLPIVDGKVVLSDITLPVDVMAQNLGFAWAEDSRTSSWNRTAIPAIVGLAGVLLGFAIGRRRAR